MYTTILFLQVPFAVRDDLDFENIRCQCIIFADVLSDVMQTHIQQDLKLSLNIYLLYFVHCH